MADYPREPYSVFGAWAHPFQHLFVSELAQNLSGRATPRRLCEVRHTKSGVVECNDVNVVLYWMTSLSEPDEVIYIRQSWYSRDCILGTPTSVTSLCGTLQMPFQHFVSENGPKTLWPSCTQTIVRGRSDASKSVQRPKTKDHEMLRKFKVEPALPWYQVAT